MLRAFDTEIRLAADANPLTQLPGNMIIGEWMSKAVVQVSYAIGYAAGDDMIKLLARMLG